MKEKWQSEWPQELGLWWFYGYQFGKKQESDVPTLCLVKVRGTAEEGVFAYIAEGHFLSAAEAVGRWHRAAPPELPEEG